MVDEGADEVGDEDDKCDGDIFGYSLFAFLFGWFVEQILLYIVQSQTE